MGQMSQKIAQLPLDFAAQESVCAGVGKGRTMDVSVAKTAIKLHFREKFIAGGSSRQHPRAVDACAASGEVERPMHVAVEQLCYDPNRLWSRCFRVAAFGPRRVVTEGISTQARPPTIHGPSVSITARALF